MYGHVFDIKPKKKRKIYLDSGCQQENSFHFHFNRSVGFFGFLLFESLQTKSKWNFKIFQRKFSSVKNRKNDKDGDRKKIFSFIKFFVFLFADIVNWIENWIIFNSIHNHYFLPSFLLSNRVCDASFSWTG